MQIQPITSNLNNNIPFKKGLYFAKTTDILFNKKANYDYFVNGNILKSRDGFRYIQDDLVSPELKNRIINLPFVKELSENFDTFIVCHKPFFSDYFKDHKSVLEIFWADYSKDYAQHKIVIGSSKKSQDLAIDNMINNLDLKIFAELKF